MSENSKQLDQMYQRLKLVLEILQTAQQAPAKATHQDDAEPTDNNNQLPKQDDANAGDENHG